MPADRTGELSPQLGNTYDRAGGPYSNFKP